MPETGEENGVKSALKQYCDKTGIILFFVLLAGLGLSLYTGLLFIAFIFVLLAGIALFSHQQVVSQRKYDHDLLYATLDCCPEGVLFLDKELKCSYCNRQAAVILGMRPDEIKGCELISLIGRETEAAALNSEIETVERVIRTGGQETVFESFFYRREKTPFPVEYRVSAIADGKKNVGALLFFQDVTAQRRLEGLLNEKVDVLEGLEKRGKIGFWEWNIARRELNISKQFRNYLSCELKESVLDDERFLHYVHPDDRPLFNEKLRNSLFSQRVIEITFRTLPEKGYSNVLHCFGRTDYDHLNKPLKVNGFCIDVSERTHLETRIQTQEQELEELKSKPQLSERSPHSVDVLRFLTGMSHDLRTPLNSILGFAQLHLQQYSEIGGNALERQNCQRIIDSGKHLLQLISDVIDYAKIEARELSLSVESCSLAGIVRESFEICNLEASQKKVDLSLGPRLTDDIIWIIGDRDRLRQVIVNLLSHIIGFCKGGEQVKIRCESMADGMMLARIIDVNRVIAPDKVLPIFSDVEPQGPQRKMQEMELRLAIAKQLIEQMEGTLLFESDVEEGNVFSLYLRPGEAGKEPAVEAEAEKEMPVLPSESISQEVKEYTLLYIEDNAANRQLVKSVLKKNVNYMLLEAEDGASGLVLARQKTPHCILLDLNLPDMSGYDVIENLKKDPLTSTIPVIALSGDVSPDEKEAAHEAGFDSFINKPINVAEFRQTVGRILTQ